MRLVLIRHGQTSSNVTGRLDTAMPGAGLTDLGRAQAAALPAALNAYDVSAVYSSPLTRTRQTAAPLCAVLGREPWLVDDLREISAGVLEMRADGEARSAYARGTEAWMAGDLTQQLGDAEDGHGFRTRYVEALAGIGRRHQAGDTVAVFSHGAAIRVATALVDPRGSAESALGRRIMNTGAAVLEGTVDEGWRLVSWHSDPLGGAHLLDAAAADPTGRDEARDARSQ